MPTTLFDSKVIEDAVTAACRAPSLHNSQPWQWVYSDGQLRLFLDSSRVWTPTNRREKHLSGVAQLSTISGQRWPPPAGMRISSSFRIRKARTIWRW